MEKYVDSNDIIKIMHEYCKEHKMSLTQYAKLAGISKAWLSRIQTEGNKKLSLYIAQRLLSVAGYEIHIFKGNTKISKVTRLKRVISSEIRR